MRKEIQPVLKLTLEKEDRFFGPGVAELLEHIVEKGSIQAACLEMDMSYSKGWKIIKRAEKELGFSLLYTHNGGAHGGRSELTTEGKEFLDQYRAVENRLKQEMEELFIHYFKEKEARGERCK
nr:LysR family transcriptional regulator [uncultured Sellimonas sp.]